MFASWYEKQSKHQQANRSAGESGVALVVPPLPSATEFTRQLFLPAFINLGITTNEPVNFAIINKLLH